MAKPLCRRRLLRAAARSLACKKARWLPVRAGDRSGLAGHRATACCSAASWVPRYKNDESSQRSCQAAAASASCAYKIQSAWSSSSHPRSLGQARNRTS